VWPSDFLNQTCSHTSKTAPPRYTETLNDCSYDETRWHTPLKKLQKNTRRRSEDLYNHIQTKQKQLPFVYLSAHRVGCRGRYGYLSRAPHIWRTESRLGHPKKHFRLLLNSLPLKILKNFFEVDYRCICSGLMGNCRMQIFFKSTTLYELFLSSEHWPNPLWIGFKLFEKLCLLGIRLFARNIFIN